MRVREAHTHFGCCPLLSPGLSTVLPGLAAEVPGEAPGLSENLVKIKKVNIIISKQLEPSCLPAQQSGIEADRRGLSSSSIFFV